MPRYVGISMVTVGWQVAIPPRGPAWDLGCGYPDAKVATHKLHATVST